MSDDIKETVCEPSATVPEQPLSKSKLKKLEKRRRWLEQKPMRRAKEKQKRKLKIQQAKETGRDLGPSRKVLKASKMCDSSCKIKVCFDLSLADVMLPEEFSKALKQLHRCYSINRRALAPLQLYITGYSDTTKQAMSKMSGCFNWDVHFNSLSHTDIFQKEKIVYLTSDSPNVIEELVDDKVYIIGALVDHNRLKNICYEKAIEVDIGHARLPLDTYFKFKTRTVLTIDQVYSILLHKTEGKTWIESVMETVPQRKGVELKEELNDKEIELPATEDNEDLSSAINDEILKENDLENDVINDID